MKLNDWVKKIIKNIETYKENREEILKENLRAFVEDPEAVRIKIDSKRMAFVEVVE